MIELRGVTWDHPRGMGPLLAASAAHEIQHPGVRVTWEARSLQAFADAPIADLAAEYDLIVIDHPHVGEVSVSGCLAPLDVVADSDAFSLLARESVGASHDSYYYSGHQWALAIDSAAQVSAFRPDRMAAAPTTWDEVLMAARHGGVVWPYKPVDALMSFFTLTSNLGSPCFAAGRPAIDRQAGNEALVLLLELARLVPEACSAMNPISALEAMSVNDGAEYCPLLFGYSNYSRWGFRPSLVRFANIPTLSPSGPVGSVLGGAGLAVSASSSLIAEATKFALWVAGADCQRTVYFEGGGQPANAAAWDDYAVNQAAASFFRDTRKTLDHAWLRPRFPGFVDFQARGGDVMHGFLSRRYGRDHTLNLLEDAYAGASGHRR